MRDKRYSVLDRLNDNVDDEFYEHVVKSLKHYLINGQFLEHIPKSLLIATLLAALEEAAADPAMPGIFDKELTEFIKNRMHG